MGKRISMQDVADDVGVSKVTVSKVLRGKSDVSESMRKEVMEAADRLGYLYNRRKSRTEISKIAVLTAEHFLGGGDCFYVKLYQYLSEELEKQDIDVTLNIIDQQSERSVAIPEKLKNRETDGVILMGQLSRDFVGGLALLQIPMAFLDFYYDGFNVTSINTDNFFSEYELTNALIRDGHTKIAFVGNLDYTSSIQDRFLGYYKALIEHHIPLRKEWVLNDRKGDGRYLSVSLPEEMPTAFVCNCDEVAMLLIENLASKGYQVPRDISVTGFDDSVHSVRSAPQITTVHVSLDEMAHLTAKAILHDIESSQHKNRILVRGKIIFRASTAKYQGKK